MGFGDAVASAGPYAHNMHLDLLQAWRPTNSVKALKAQLM